MKITKQEALDLYNGLQAVGNLPGAKWAYAVARNINILQPEINSLQKAYAINDKKYQEFNNKREELARKHAKKEDGKPKKINTGNKQEYILEDTKAFEKEFKKLKKEYKNAVEKREKQIEEFNEILKEKIEIDLYMINPDYIPEKITPAQVSNIMLIIDERKLDN